MISDGATRQLMYLWWCPEKPSISLMVLWEKNRPQSPSWSADSIFRCSRCCFDRFFFVSHMPHFCCFSMLQPQIFGQSWTPSDTCHVGCGAGAFNWRLGPCGGSTWQGLQAVETSGYNWAVKMLDFNLVGGLEHFFVSICWDKSSQLTNIFQRGGSTSNQLRL